MLIGSGKPLLALLMPKTLHTLGTAPIQSQATLGLIFRTLYLYTYTKNKIIQLC